MTETDKALVHIAINHVEQNGGEVIVNGIRIRLIENTINITTGE